MTVIKNIMGRVFAVWAIIIFVISMLLIYLPFFITGFWPEPKRTILFIRLSRIWMKIFFTLVGVRRKFVGRNHFAPNQNYVVVCNHNSFMDVPLSSPGIPGTNKTIAKKEMARIPLFGIMYQRGSVLVDRSSEESRKASFQKMKQVISWGLHMCIYPEGTRNKGREPLQRFHDGAFRLAIETGSPVLPALIFNSAKILPPNKFFFWPRPVEMHFLEPIPPGAMTRDQLKEKVFSIMEKYYLLHKK